MGASNPSGLEKKVHRAGLFLSLFAVHLSAHHITLHRPAMDGSMELGELHRTIQLRSPGLKALSLRRYQTARILHASLRRWLDL